jgi:integrase
MKRSETLWVPVPAANASSSSRTHKYQKVLDNRKQPIRGLWRRNGNFLARLTVEDSMGRKTIKWSPLAAKTPGEAQSELRTLLVERKENRLRKIGLSPKFSDYLDQTFLPLRKGAGKKPATFVTESAHYNRWRQALGHLRLDKIRSNHIQESLNQLRAIRSARTCNMALVCLRHVLKAAKRDKHIKFQPFEDVPWLPTVTKERRSYELSEIEKICTSALTATKNGQQFADYIRFLAFSGSREQEALSIRWQNVDFKKGLLSIGAEGESKNGRVRHVNLNPSLFAHLRDMESRHAVDSQWLFPSPQRGEQDVHSRTFRESLKLARAQAGLDQFGFHDCRHFFISMCVMAKIDFMTIAKWVGHRDGGVLIGKVYGHLEDEHTQRQAEKLVLNPMVTQKNEKATVSAS